MRTSSGVQFGLTLVLAALCLAAAVRVPSHTPTPLEKPTQGGTDKVEGVDFACSLCLFLSADANKNLHKPASYENFKKVSEFVLIGMAVSLSLCVCVCPLPTHPFIQRPN